MSRPKPVRHCITCRHRERAAIELALARGVSGGAVAKRYGLSVDSVYRHRANHMPPQLRAKLVAGPSLEGVDLDRLRETESQSLLMHLIAIRNRLLGNLDLAEESGDAMMVSRTTSQLHKNLELTGRLLGDLSAGATTVNNVLVMPAYIEMRVAIVRALAPFPDARMAVAGVLHRLEGEAAQAVTAEAARGLAR